MLRFAAIAVLFAAVCAVPINDNSKSEDHDVIVVDNINNHLVENPGAELIGELEKRDLVDSGGRAYNFGKRVKGDRIVASKIDSGQWFRNTNITTQIDYPPFGGNGSIVTRVEIWVDHVADSSRAYIVSGGIGQRKISVVTKIINALGFEYDATIYGYDAPI